MRRGRLRQISVDGRAYRWNYYYDDMDFENYPYSYYLFVPEENQRLKVRVYFTKYAPQMNLDCYITGGDSLSVSGRTSCDESVQTVFRSTDDKVCLWALLSGNGYW